MMRQSPFLAGSSRKRARRLGCPGLAAWMFAIAVTASVLLSARGGVEAQSAVTITVDAAANRHPIDPNIYGLAYASTAQLQELRVPLHRQGGNNTSRYNWQLNADNRGSDWYFESIGDASATPGERGDTFI